MNNKMLISILQDKPPAIVQEKEISWEECVSLGMELREKKDNSQWALGDLALTVQKQYGMDSLGKFAVEIGIKKSTLADYRTCSAFYPSEIRERYRDLSHSFFLVAMRNNDLETAIAWLNRASDEGWSVEMLRKMIKGGKEEKSVEEVIKGLIEKIDKLCRDKSLSLRKIREGLVLLKKRVEFWLQEVKKVYEEDNLAYREKKDS